MKQQFCSVGGVNYCNPDDLNLRVVQTPDGLVGFRDDSAGGLKYVKKDSLVENYFILQAPPPTSKELNPNAGQEFVNATARDFGRLGYETGKATGNALINIPIGLGNLPISQWNNQSKPISDIYNWTIGGYFGSNPNENVFGITPFKERRPFDYLPEAKFESSYFTRNAEGVINGTGGNLGQWSSRIAGEITPIIILGRFGGSTQVNSLGELGGIPYSNTPVGTYLNIRNNLLASQEGRNASNFGEYAIKEKQIVGNPFASPNLLNSNKTETLLLAERSVVPSKIGVIVDKDGNTYIGRGNSNAVPKSSTPIELPESKISDIINFPTKQLDRKFKHAEDFGIITTRKNNATIKQFENAVLDHLRDSLTKAQGTYLYEPGSKVYFNPKTNLIVIVDKNNSFLSGWKLTPGTPQFTKFIKDGILR